MADPDVIVVLAYFYDVSAHDYELVSGGLPKYRALVRERLPWKLQEYIWDANCQTTVPAVDYVDYEFELVRCAPPPDPAATRAAATALRADGELQDALRGRLSQLKVSEAGTGRLVQRTDNAIRALEATP